MASTVENSAASVPIAELARMHEQLLQEPPLDFTAKLPYNGPERSQQSARDAAVALPGYEPESAPLQHLSSSPRKRLPGITTAKSASAADMEGTVNASPSQEAFKALTRASSFHGYTGDTQPLESQVYRDFKETTAQSMINVAAEHLRQLSPRPGLDTDDTQAMSKTPRTCVDGDTGYIDLEHAFTSPVGVSYLPDTEACLTSPEARIEEGNPTAFSAPATPSAAGHKRRHNGEIVTSDSPTLNQPAYSQLFGGAQFVPMLSTTQLFNQTQAPSSPMLGEPRSDPVLTRPSPNLHTHLNTSSPRITMSSPVATMRPSTAGEPRDRYTSMWELQERRAARIRAEAGAARDLDDNLLSDDEDNADGEQEQDAQLRQFQNRRLQRAKSYQTQSEFERFKAPIRKMSRPAPSPKPPTTIDLTTPAALKIGEAVDFEVSSDGNDTDDGETMISEHEQEDEVDDDEYDELGQTILRSQGPQPEEEHDILVGNAGAAEVALTKLDAPDPVDRLGAQSQRTALSKMLYTAIANSQPLGREHVRPASAGQEHQPSSISVVPGSQYPARTSQDQLRIADRSLLSSKQKASSASQHEQGRSCSNPSVRAEPAATHANSAVHDPGLMHHDEEPTVPDSDMPELVADRQESSQPVTVDEIVTEDDDQTPQFSTARDHLSAPDVGLPYSGAKLSPVKGIASQRSVAASQSPFKAAGFRRFADIAGVPPLPAGESRETDVDIDAFMRDIVTTEDRQFLDAVSSPPPRPAIKRRRPVASNPPAVHNSPKPADSPSRSRTATLPIPLTSPQITIEQGTLNAEEMTTTAEQEVRATRPLQESPSKANEMPPGTQESAIEREKAGAKAASMLISNRVAKPAARKESANARKRRAKVYGKSKSAAVKADLVLPAAVISLEPQPPSEIPAGVDDSLQANAVPDAVQSRSDQPATMLAPNRIFALFKGQYNSFHPATFIGHSADGLKYHVRFDDGNKTFIEVQHVRRLELREGDHVKINVEGMRKQTWIVKSASNVWPVKDNDAIGGDIFGRRTLHVQAKAGRDSITGDQSAGKGHTGISKVDMSDVYLTHTLWPHHADRAFEPPSLPSAQRSRASTPTSASKQNMESPSSKRRRKTQSASTLPAESRIQSRDEAPMPVFSPSHVGIFSGMIFALSYGPNGTEKDEVARLIRRHGGAIIEDGFEVLFNLPSLEDSPAETTSADGANASEQAALQLRPQYRNISFAALIADKHSRREKYMQALALGLPTLAGRWIMDSLNPSKNSTLGGQMPEPLQWSTYLLPAGESTYLGGATRSRTLPVCSARKTVLQETIASREILLHGDGVIIVASKKSKGSWERSKTYAFLTLALGASRVTRVTDLTDAQPLTSSEPAIWRWVYVDGAVADASATLFGADSKGGRKRKHSDIHAKTCATQMSVVKGDVRIVNDEFVVQSLILGALVD